MRVVFMGTPDFAVYSLKALCDNGYTPVAVISQTDKPRGRGNKLSPTPVKAYAESLGIPVYQPKTLRDEEFATLLSQIDPDLIAVAAYGKILPQNVLSYPKYGCICVHGSLLPKYRGAAPMQRAIIDGESVTGITTMLMDDGIDTGDMLLKEEIEILPDDNFENIHDKLAVCGAELLIKTIEGLVSGSITPEKQPNEGACYASKIEKSELLTGFSADAREIHNMIRGLSPIPLAYTVNAKGERIKLVRSCVVSEEAHSHPAGKVVALLDKGEGRIDIACGKGIIGISSIVPEGKGRMTASEYVRGRKISVGDILGADVTAE